MIIDSTGDPCQGAKGRITDIYDENESNPIARVKCSDGRTFKLFLNWLMYDPSKPCKPTGSLPPFNRAGGVAEMTQSGMPGIDGFTLGPTAQGSGAAQGVIGRGNGPGQRGHIQTMSQLSTPDQQAQGISSGAANTLISHVVGSAQATNMILGMANMNGPRPPPAREKRYAPGQWNCERCTFINQDKDHSRNRLVSQCSMCSSARPELKPVVDSSAEARRIIQEREQEQSQGRPDMPPTSQDAAKAANDVAKYAFVRQQQEQVNELARIQRDNDLARVLEQSAMEAAKQQVDGAVLAMASQVMANHPNLMLARDERKQPEEKRTSGGGSSTSANPSTVPDPRDSQSDHDDEEPKREFTYMARAPDGSQIRVDHDPGRYTKPAEACPTSVEPASESALDRGASESSAVSNLSAGGGLPHVEGCS